MIVMKVAKFGGSSLADGAQLKKVIKIIVADDKRQVIVTSAPGKRDKNDTKVTDLLITYAKQTLQRQDTSAICQAIFDRYLAIAQYFALPEENLTELHKILFELKDHVYPDAKYLMAAFKAHGERLNAYLIAKILNHLGIKARFIDPKEVGFLVTSEPNNATVLPQTYQALAQLPVGEERLIVPGFFGLTKEGQIATFSRGGSDITGAILACALKAECYENFTDVDAIYVANPKIVTDPAAITTMTYREMRELAYAGFSVFHDEAIIPAIQGQIPINVKNTNHPELPGTWIVPETGFMPTQTITGVVNSNHFSALYLHKYLLNKEVGATLKLLEIMYKYQISYEHMPSGIDDLTIIFDSDLLTPETKQLMCEDIQAALQPDQLEWIDDYAIIMVVGEGMRDHKGVTQKIIDSVSEHDIGIHMINQGASRISLMLGTKRADAANAVKYIYQTFFEEENK